MGQMDDWEKTEIIHKNKIKNFDFLKKNDFITEIEDGYYYISEDIEVVETAFCKKINEELANELNIEDIEEELKLFIKKLNTYNELKDIGQDLIGKIATFRGTTNKSIHEELDMNDD